MKHTIIVWVCILLCGCVSTRKAVSVAEQQTAICTDTMQMADDKIEQKDISRNSVSITITTAESKSTTDIYDNDTASNIPDQPTIKQSTTTESKIESKTITVDEAAIRSVIAEQVMMTIEQQTAAEMQHAEQSEDVKEDSTPTTMRWTGIIAICTTICIAGIAAYFFLRRLRI